MTGLLSFMNDTAPTLGSITSSDSEKRALARKSREFNLKVGFSFCLCVLFQSYRIVGKEVLGESRNF